jgi:hypothetical protein
VLTFRRTTTREVELHGQTLAPGEKVVLFYHSGNRDELAFERPWSFDITRSPNRHLGLGGGGPHYCMGASLARTQLQAIYGEMLRVMPDIEAGEPELLRSASFTASSGCRARSPRAPERLLTPHQRKLTGTVRPEDTMESADRATVPGSERRLDPDHRRVGDVEGAQQIEVTVSACVAGLRSTGWRGRATADRAPRRVAGPVGSRARGA